VEKDHGTVGNPDGPVILFHFGILSVPSFLFSTSFPFS